MSLMKKTAALLAMGLAAAFNPEMELNSQEKDVYIRRGVQMPKKKWQKRKKKIRMQKHSRRINRK